MKKWNKINTLFRWYNYIIGKSKINHKWNKNKHKAWNHKGIKEDTNVFFDNIEVVKEDLSNHDLKCRGHFKTHKIISQML